MPTDPHALVDAVPPAEPIARGNLRVASWLQRLSVNGNAAAVVIRRQVLQHLGWHRGMTLAVDVMSDDTLRIREVTAKDLRGAAPREFRQPVLLKGKP